MHQIKKPATLHLVLLSHRVFAGVTDSNTFLSLD